MCGQHSSEPVRPTGSSSGQAGDGNSARPASREFAWLKQSDPVRAAAYHCTTCQKDGHAAGDTLRTLAVVGIVITAVGVLVMLVSLVPGLVLFLVGGGLAATALVMRSQRPAPDPGDLPPLPLFPHVNTVDVIERVHGRVSFAAGVYKSTVDGPATGEITIDMSATDGQKWLPRYRKRYRVPDDAPVRFAAGFAMIKGTAGLRFHSGQNVALPGGTGLWLRADSAIGHQLFEHVPGHRPGEWILSTHYDVFADKSPEKIPLWIVPSIVPSSDRRTLEIDLHWNQLGPRGGELTFTRFDSIELEVPASWGAMQSADPSGATVDSTRKGVRIIRWESVGPSDGQRPQGTASAGEVKSRALKLHFENPVLWVPEASGNGVRPKSTQEPHFTGSLKAVFEKADPAAREAGTLSGIGGIDIYLAGGGRARQQPQVRVRTEVTVDFDIDLSAVRYQDDWVVPDDSNAWAAVAAANGHDGTESGFRQDRPHDDTFVGVVPDHVTVGELTNLISGKGYYVKSVVEHPPFRDDGRANVVNRVWDIAGRWYHGVFPIDFDVNLRGQEMGEEVPGPFSGQTVAQVIVKGTYVNDAGLSQRTMIEERWNDLYTDVSDLLRRRAVGGSGLRSIAPVASPRAWEDPAARAASWNDRASDPIVVDAVIVDEAPSATRTPADDRQAGRETLRQQWRDADDAVMAGRIAEETHARIVARIQDELRGLGEQA
jgi:hypothetical protein